MAMPLPFPTEHAPRFSNALVTEIATVARLDREEVRRSRWLQASFLLYGLLAVLFVFAAMRESNVLGYTGTGRVLLSFVHALLLLLPLLALSATSQTLNRAREDGSFELLFAQPLSVRGYYAGITLTRAAALLLPLLVLFVAVPVAARLAFGDPLPWSYVLRCALVSAALLWCFIGIGLWLSASIASPARATLAVLLVWAAAVALLDFALLGVVLEWRLGVKSVFALAALNPVQCARLALLSGQDPELQSFGPVGFFLAQKLGARGLLALGLGWPALAGTLAWLAGLRRLRRADLV